MLWANAVVGSKSTPTTEKLDDCIFKIDVLDMKHDIVSKSISRLALVPFAPLLLFNTTNAQALTYDSDEVAAERVRLNDLDLQTAKGWHRAKVRVSTAVGRVYAPELTLVNAARCHRESILRAQQELARYSGTRDALARIGATDSGSAWRRPSVADNAAIPGAAVFSAPRHQRCAAPTVPARFAT
jgi:UrcA family protein